MKIFTSLLALTGAAYATEYCCTIYSETDYQGESHQICHDSAHQSIGNYWFFKDSYATLYQLSDIGIDWNVASIQCKADTYYTACHSQYANSYSFCAGQAVRSGFFWNSYGENRDLTDTHFDLNLIGIGYQEPDFDQYRDYTSEVTIYESSDCTGPSMSSLSDPSKIIFGQAFPYLNVPHYAGTEKLASIRIPTDWAVNLYSEWNHATVPFKTIQGQDGECFTFDEGRLRSMKIYESKTPPRFATGEWKKLAQTSQGATYQYHQGLTSTEYSMTRDEMSSSITASMEKGIEFGASTTTYSISATISNSIVNEVSNTSTIKSDQTFTYACNPAKEGNNGASLWQWVVGNGTVSSRSNTLICRNGEHWNSAPKCPPAACKHAQCEQCNPWQQ